MAILAIELSPRNATAYNRSSVRSVNPQVIDDVWRLKVSTAAFDNQHLNGQLTVCRRHGEGRVWCDDSTTETET